MKKLILSGNVPYLAVLILCVTAFFAGQQLHPAPKRIAVAEKKVVLLEAMMDRGGKSQEVINAEIVEPVRGVLKRYVDQGYLVVDISKDVDGNMLVAAMPADAVDITSELRAAVGLSADRPAFERAKSP